MCVLEASSRIAMNGWFLHLDSRDYLLRIVQHQRSFNCRISNFLCVGCQDVHTMLIGLSCNSIHLDILPVKCWNVLQNRDFIIIDTQLSLTSFTSLLRLSYLNSCSVVIVLACYYYQDYIRDHSQQWSMLDYRVAYTHQSVYPQRVETPVRIFTNIALSRVPSPQEAGYIMCLDCNMWIFYATRFHCFKCNKCTSIGGIWCPHVGNRKDCNPTSLEDEVAAIVASELDFDPRAASKVRALIEFLKAGIVEKVELADK